MNWMLYWVLSVLCLVASVVTAFVCGRQRGLSHRVGPVTVLLAGTVASAAILYVPIYLSEFSTDQCGWLETVFMAGYSMVRLFLADGEFTFILSNLNCDIPEIHKAYTILFSVLFVLAPVLTFGVALSFFKNISAYIRYLLNYNTETYVFSELSEKSLTLAQSLRENGGKRNLVFTDVEEKDGKQGELAQRAKELGAICFRRDMLTVNLDLHKKGSVRRLFLIREDQSENTRQAMKLLEKLKKRENTEIFVFSSLQETELALSKSYVAMDDDKEKQIIVRRINEVRSLIIRNLYDTGYESVFKSAVAGQDGMKQINALVVGMGQHGTEMAKALPWFGQMDGYDLCINVVDADKMAEEKFISACPELMKYSGKNKEKGDARYRISVHPGMDVETAAFDRLLERLPRTTYAFVALGSDEKNIAAAMKLRMLFLRMGYKPVIQTVVYDTERKESVSGAKNAAEQNYDIMCVGDLRASYSEEVILASDLEQKAKERHLKWGSEREFWQYEYYYNSSVSSVVHHKMKILCGIPGADLEPEKREDTDRVNLRMLEHSRWNAYMRAQGFVYGGSNKREEGRDDMAKRHNNLLPFAELLPKEQEKDDD